MTTPSTIRRNRFLIPSILIILIATLMPGDGKIAGNYLDKVVHFGIFFFLAINILYKFKEAGKQTKFLLWCISLGLLTEFTQQFIPGRNLDFYDVVADTLGVVFAFHFYQYKQALVEQLWPEFGA